VQIKALFCYSFALSQKKWRLPRPQTTAAQKEEAAFPLPEPVN
jgi:hypothetical protein